LACPLGFTLTQCVDDHWCRALEGRRVGSHWRARCPLCKREDAFEISITGTGANARLKWNCHTKPKCDHAVIRRLLAALLPCKMAARDPRPDVLARQIGKLICSDLDPAELKLKIGQLIWPEMSAAQVADELGLSRATRYRLKCPPSVSRLDIAAGRLPVGANLAEMIWQRHMRRSEYDSADLTRTASLTGAGRHT
jgi:hypothetical protein